jgi:hypothetical protein
MAHVEDVIKKNETYQCDNCKENFKAENIEFCDPVDNINILTPPAPFIYVDKTGTVTGGTKQPSKKLGDKLLCCPHCHGVHLFGFDIIDPKN